MSAETSSTATLKPRRRWLQFSLRSLLVVMLLCALAAAWVGNEIAQGMRQIAAAEWVEQQGGVVYYAEQTEPRWQQKWLGDWYPNRVTHIDLAETNVESLEPLTSFPQLGALSLADTTLGDLDTLMKLTELRFLDLSDARSKLPELRPLLQQPGLLVWHGDASETDGRRPPIPNDVQLQIIYRLGEGPLVAIPHGDDLIVQTSEQVVCLAANRQFLKWRIAFQFSAYEPEAGYLELPDGGLIFYGYSAGFDSGVDLLRIDPETGTQRWKTVTGNSGWGMSVEWYHQEVAFKVLDESLLIVSDSGLSIWVEERRLEDGQLLHHWQFDNSYLRR